MDRAALASLAAEKGWSELLFRATADGPQWGVGYGVGAARVMLTGTDSTSEQRSESDRPVLRPAQRACSVELGNPEGDWRAEIAALAADLDYSADLGPALSEGDPREGREWSRNGKGLLRMVYNPATGVLNVALVRITDPEIRLLPSTNE
ncbi:hypothetical protein [Brevundimonas sp.]|uniref:hypothetical protein n=2 Tax=unclassified Brevundimonas TaxID=2622653 RepID=UPI002FCAEF38